MDWNKQWRERRKNGYSIEPEIDPILILFEYFFCNLSASVIEVGCGSGLRTLHLTKKYGLRTYLFDQSDVALEFARENAEKLGVTAHCIKGDLLDNSLDSDRYDIVWSAGLNEHFFGKDRQRAFDEMYRICKPNGTCIVITPNTLNLPYRLEKKIKEILGTWPYGDEQPFTRWELSKYMHRSGFNDVETVGIGALLSPYKWFFLDSSYANKLLKNPTPFKALNELLRRVDLDVGPNNYLNNIFGRELAAKGTKP